MHAPTLPIKDFSINSFGGYSPASDALYARQYSIADYIEHALSLSNFEELCVFIEKIKYDFGLNVFGACEIVQNSSAENSICVLYDSNTEWVDFYRQGLIYTDPFIGYCEENVTPLVWRAAKDMTELRKICPKIAEGIGDLNINTFITLPVHSCGENMSGFRFGNIGNTALPESDLYHALPFLSLLSSYLFEALHRLHLEIYSVKKPAPKLTAREREVLLWISRGKTTWEISQILNISENTVLTYIKRFFRKLGVQTRQHAIAKAMSLRLICP